MALLEAHSPPPSTISSMTVERSGLWNTSSTATAGGDQLTEALVRGRKTVSPMLLFALLKRSVLSLSSP